MKQTVILRKRNAPKVINLPNGRSFTSKWQRISRKQLPINIKVQRQKKIGPRKNNRIKRLKQSGKGLGLNLLKWGMIQGQKQSNLNLAKK